MKVTKRLLAILMSVCMMIGMISMTAFADGTTPTASITVQNVSGTNASVGGKTLNLFKIFEATTSGSNTAYQWIIVNKGTEDEYNLYESFFFGDSTIVDENNEPVYKRRVAGDSIHDVIDYINGLHKTDSFEFSQMASDLHQYIHDKNINPTATSNKIDEAATSYTFSKLELGYYMIYDATQLDNQSGPAVRSAAMLAHAGENKVINLKADRPHIEKYVQDGVDAEGNVIWKNGTTASVGDTVTFRIVTMIPDHDLYGSNYLFEIEDTMDDTLQLHTNSIQVVVTEPNSTLSDKENTAPVEGEGNIETEENDVYNIVLPNQANGETYDFKVTFDNITTLEKDTLIDITYTADVLATADSINENTVKLKYSNDPNNANSFGEAPSKVNVLLWNFILTKYMEDANGVPSYVRLGGAKFEIYKKNETAPLKFTSETTENGITKYIYNPNTTEDGITELETCNSGTGNEDIGYNTEGGHLGEIAIFGLGEGTYVIVEKEAPDGYQIAKGEFEFTLSDSVGPNGTIGNATISEAERNEIPGQFTRVTVREALQTYYIGITNRPGQALPETGGIGSTIYMVAGLAIMVSAAAVLVYKKRNSAK